MRAAPPRDETVRIAVPPLLFQERRDRLGEPLLHVDKGTVLVEHQRIDFLPQDVGRFHHVSHARVTMCRRGGSICSTLSPNYARYGITFHAMIVGPIRRN